jgi:hypothetical protein
MTYETLQDVGTRWNIVTHRSISHNLAKSAVIRMTPIPEHIFRKRPNWRSSANIMLEIANCLAV